MANTTVQHIMPSDNLVTNDINEMVSDLGVIPSDHNSPIISSGCSGFETLTGLVNPTGFGNLTAVLQVQGGVSTQGMIILLNHPLTLNIMLLPHHYCLYLLIAEPLPL